jgi:hypothetical protein
MDMRRPTKVEVHRKHAEQREQPYDSVLHPQAPIREAATQDRNGEHHCCEGDGSPIGQA